MAKKPLLTRRKAAWVNTFKPNVIRGKPLNPSATVEFRYYEKLSSMVGAMVSEVEREITKLFSGDIGAEYFTQDASISSQARILTNALKKKYDGLFATNAPGVAESMVAQSDKTSSQQLHSSIQQLSGGLSLPTTILTGPLKDVVTASIAENVALIKSIPQKYLFGVQGAVMRSITTGNGLQDLVPYLADNKGVTLRRARFIAKDQTKKVFENLSRERMIRIGVKKGEWLHTGGSNHPRKTHIAMTGKIFDLTEGLYDSEVSENVKPGQLPGCRCRTVPVLEFGG